MSKTIDWANEPADYRLDHKIATELLGEDSPDGGHLIGYCVDWGRVPELIEAARKRWPDIGVNNEPVVDDFWETRIGEITADGWNVAGRSQGETLPLALCRAIALALDAEEAGG